MKGYTSTSQVRALIPSFHPRTRLEHDSAPLAISIAFPGLQA